MVGRTTLGHLPSYCYVIDPQPSPPPSHTVHKHQPPSLIHPFPTPSKPLCTENCHQRGKKSRRPRREQFVGHTWRSIVSTALPSAASSQAAILCFIISSHQQQQQPPLPHQSRRSSLLSLVSFFLLVEQVRGQRLFLSFSARTPSQTKGPPTCHPSA